MEKEISIDSLNIKIGGREISLSVAEAKKLKKALEDLFGRDVIKEIDHHWYYKYTRPYYEWDYNKFYCKASTDTHFDKMSYATGSQVMCLDIS